MPGDDKGKLVPSFLIYINGQRIKDKAIAAISEIIIEDYLNTPTMFTLTLNDSGREWADSDLLFLQSEVKIDLGYLNDITTMVVGEITALDAGYTKGSPDNLTVRGFDRMHRLKHNRKTRTFVQMKDSQIAAQIAQEVGLNPKLEETNVVHDYLLQDNQTDLEFLLERAKRIRYELGVEDKILKFIKSRENLSENVILEWGKTLIEFYSSLSIAHQASEVEVRGWDTKKQQVIIAHATSGDEITTMKGNNSGGKLIKDFIGDSKVIMIDNSIHSQNEAENIAQAKFNEISMDFITAEGTCSGNPKIRAGTILELKALGKRFSGNYYVVSSTHIFHPEGYTTSFSVRRNAV